MEGTSFVLSLIRKSEESWLKVSEETCNLTRLVGNSNKVYLISTSLPITPKRFIFRIFGSSLTLNNLENSSIFRRLSQNNKAPKIYFETSDYRLEEYLEGTRNIHRLECLQSSMAYKIGKALKEFHSHDLSDILDSKQPVCIKNAEKWKKIAENNLSLIKDSQRQGEIDRAKNSLQEVYYEMFIDILPKESPLVLTHMDTSFLNFLYHEAKEEIFLIDYDYSGYCYRGFDIAMLLQDVKFDYNYPVYPFYQYSPEIIPSERLLAEYVKAYGQGVDMFIECKKCMIAAHYFWATWAFSLYKEDTNEMDMLGYGLLRFNEFLNSYCEFKTLNENTLRENALQYFNLTN